MNDDKPLCCRCKNSKDAVRRGHTLCLAFYLKEAGELWASRNLDLSFIHKKKHVLEYQKEITIESDDYDSSTVKTIYVYTTLLHIACKKGFGDCARLLLSDEHVNINFKDGDDMTPLELMCSEQFTFNADPILILLLKDSRIVIDCYSNIYRYDAYVYRPFYSYVRENLENINLDIVQLFLSKDADTTNGLEYSENSYTRNNVFELACFSSYMGEKNGKLISLLLDSGKIPLQSIEKVKKNTYVESRIMNIINEWEESALSIKEPSCS